MGQAVNAKPRSWCCAVGESGLNVNVDGMELKFEFPGDSVSSLGKRSANLLRLENLTRKPTLCPNKGS